MLGISLSNNPLQGSNGSSLSAYLQFHSKAVELHRLRQAVQEGVQVQTELKNLEKAMVSDIFMRTDVICCTWYVTLVLVCRY